MSSHAIPPSDAAQGPSQGDDGRASQRRLFRVVGGTMFGLSLVLIVLAFADFFSAFGMAPRGPTKMWMFFAAVPLFAVGGFLLQLGFAQAGARYLAGEAAPVLRDSMDQLGLRATGAVGTRPTAGSETDPKSRPYCRSCGVRSDADARFCTACGTALS